MNSFTQSNYAVGSTNVTYTFNFTVGSYIPPKSMLQIILPAEVGLNATSSSLIFYDQNVISNPTQVLTSLIFYVNYSGTHKNNFALLTITGFTNPQFIGNS